MNDLPGLLARHARALRSAVGSDIDSGGPFAGIAARAIGVDDFADAYAQTAAYLTFLDKVGAGPKLTPSDLLGQVRATFAREDALDVVGETLDSLGRELDCIDLTVWGEKELLLYEAFLGLYDPATRQSLGVYYTPRAVVEAQVRLAHQALIDLVGLPQGLASPEVTVVDPATGTGSYLLSVSSHRADNLYGFEIMDVPHALAQARAGFADIVLGDTLSVTEPTWPSTPATVVVGNPPYKRGLRAARPEFLKPFIEPLRGLGLASSAKNLHNDYVYFWRWALLQTCERRPDSSAVVSFVTASSFLRGPGFAGMRQVLREQFESLWIIDLGGQGRQGRREANVFDIRSPVAIAMGVRRAGITSTDCTVNFMDLSSNSRDDIYAALDSIDGLADSRWSELDGSAGDWLAPSATDDSFLSWPSLSDLMPYNTRGIQFSRSWVTNQCPETLAKRWDSLLSAPASEQPGLLVTTRDVSMDKGPRSFRTGKPMTPLRDLSSTDQPEAVEQVWFRSFDVQWAISDRRVIDRPRPELWSSASQPHQLFLTTMQAPSSGPAIIAAHRPPDLNSFRGSAGGVVYPMLRGDGSGNVADGLLDRLGGVEVQDLAAYLVGVAGTGAYLARFADQVRESCTVRVPITAQPELFAQAVSLGRRLIAASIGKPEQGVAFERIAVPPGHMPTDFEYDPESGELHVGEGVIARVSPEVWEFEVSGLRVVKSWLAYRMANRAGRKSSQLERDIVPSAWNHGDELVRLCWTLETLIEAVTEAGSLLDAITTGELLD